MYPRPAKPVLSSLLLGLLVLLTACQSSTRDAAAAEKQAQIDSLLVKARLTFEKGQLTSPDKDNAFYFYQKVLVLQPDQAEALSGREAIFDSYLGMARDALDKHNYSQALAQVDKAETVLLPSKASKALRQQILDAQKQAAAHAAAKATKKPAASLGKNTGIEYLLSMKGLNEKDKAIRDRLKLIAEHVAELKNNVIIEARSQEEAEWILQQMKKAVPHYHFLNEIRLVEHPRILLLQPED